VAKRTFALGLITFWVLMTGHCGWERIPLLKFLACSPAAETPSHRASDCGDNDACATVESGQYRTEESQVLAPPASLIQPVFVLALLFELSVPEPRVLDATPDSHSSELAQVWQFFSRTALPPRAPSLLT